MLGRSLVRLETRDASPAADAQTVLDAVAASGAAQIFRVRIGPRGAFSHVPLPCHEGNGGFEAGDGGLLAEQIGACLAAAAPIRYEERHGADGCRQITLMPVADGGGRISEIVGIVLDVGERKRIEVALSATERRFQSIAANLPGVVYQRLLQPDGRLAYPYVSEGARRLFKIEPEALQRDAELMLRSIHPDDLPLFRRALDKSARELSPFEVEVRNILASGEEIWVRSVAQPVRLADGGVLWNGLILDVTDRRRAEAQVLEREAWLRDFAEAASDWLWETDEELRFTRVSDRFFEICGIPAATMIGRRRDEIADPSFEPERWREHQRLLSERRPFRDFIYRSVLDGAPAGYVKESGRPVFDAKGAFRGYRGTGTDLTAQRQAEEHAARASRQLLDAVEGLSEGVAIFDAKDALLLCNARYREINSAIAEFLAPGLSFESLLRKGVERGLYPAAIGSEEEWIAERLAGHQSANSHFERQGSDGHWLQVLEQRTPGGGTTILATDITEVKRRELALSMLAAAGQDGGDFFADAVVSLAAGLGYRCAGIAGLADDGRRIVPLAFCEGGLLAPGAEQEVAGTPCETVLEEAGFWAVDSDVTLHYPEDRVLAARGAVAYVGDIVVDAMGDPVAIVFGFDDKPDPDSAKRRDITGLIAARIGLELQQREAEKQLREAKEAAELASRAKTEFLANMSHELRTPLNAIIGFSQMIGDEVLGPAGRAEYKDYARDINASSQHLLQIINDILDVSKIEAGMLALRATEADVASLLKSCRRLVEPRAEESGIALETAIPEELPVIVADERMVKQIVLNLLSNAVKFTPRGGVVALRADGEVDGGIRITVRDTGIGIASEDFERIFRPFSQVDSSLNRKFEGTGLGLPLTKGLVELHHGTLSLDSEVGRGTTVTVLLPPGRR